MDIPTGRVLKHGIFGAGTYVAFQKRAMNHPTTSLREEVAIRLNFGLFDRVEVGLSHLWHEDGFDQSPFQVAHLKTQLLKESGVIPSVAVGVENLGDKVILPRRGDELGEHPSQNPYYEPSVFLVVSKTFNLPRIHHISGHIGVGNHRFAAGELPIGLFAGVDTEFQPAFARGDIALSVEFDGSGVNAGVRHTATSGLQVALGVKTLSKPAELHYLVSVAWTNERMMEQIAETKRLVQRAARLVSEAKRAAKEKERPPEP